MMASDEADAVAVGGGKRKQRNTTTVGCSPQKKKRLSCQQPIEEDEARINQSPETENAQQIIQSPEQIDRDRLIGYAQQFALGLTRGLWLTKIYKLWEGLDKKVQRDLTETGTLGSPAHRLCTP